MPLVKIIRLFHTLRYLRPRQVAYQVFYRLSGRLLRNMAEGNDQELSGKARRRLVAREEGGQIPARGKPTGPVPGGVSIAETAGVATFTFLNQSATFAYPAGTDWNFAGYGKLWTYNLNYFEFLRGMPLPQGETLIADWIRCEATHRDAWEPYPISLRLVSWLRFYADHGTAPSPLVQASLGRQYRALWAKREYHLGGNHLLENAIALCLCAVFLADERGLVRAARLLTTELGTQYLADGGHYERSPMYQLILLDRQLTLFAGLRPAFRPSPGLAGASATATVADLMNILRASLEKQLGWLSAFCTADGRFAHFNDSCDGIAPGPLPTLQRAAALGIKPAALALGASGYRRLSSAGIEVWIDVAPIGPDDLPGHAHADTLTFELYHHGQPLLVDTGTSTYEKNARRAWERSTVAHNTVSVGGRNSSDVWGGFRVGRRARIEVLIDTEREVAARHNGYPGGHSRSFRLIGTRLLGTDTLPANVRGIARFHFAPERDVRLHAGHLLTDTGAVFRWQGGHGELVDYEKATGWNQLIAAKCLQVSFTGTLHWSIDCG